MTHQAWRILVIDDVPDNLFLLRSLLEQEGFAVDVAEDADSAMAILPRFDPDLLLIDVMMPGMNGYELTRKIRQDRLFSAVPIVLITASIEACRVKGLAVGATEFLRKPIDIEELLSVLEQLLHYSRKSSSRDFLLPS
ncbi:MAG: response regulator [Leptolyngbyaceae cyanobacterium bins.302]|nr:response regulator [Leptolyngbyaceae cyanobacterium bins.302]